MKSKFSKKTKRTIYWIIGIVSIMIILPFMIAYVDKVAKSYITYYNSVQNINKEESYHTTPNVDNQSTAANYQQSNYDMKGNYLLSDTCSVFPEEDKEDYNHYPPSDSLSEIDIYRILYSKGNYSQDLKQIITENNKQCPLRIGDGMAVAIIIDEKDYITHYCIVDENEWNLKGMSHHMPTIESMKLAMQDYISSSSKNDELRLNTIILYIKNEKGIKYHFYGSQTDSSFDITFSCKELKKIIGL